MIVRRGGRGGLGNVHFRHLDQPGSTRGAAGRAGRGALADLELKLLADVGLVGYPNAGSPRCSRWSRAPGPRSPTIPSRRLCQTGRWPVVGDSRGDDDSFSMADMPG